MSGKHYPPSYMAKKNIAEICHYCERLEALVDEGDQLPQWVEHKLSQMRTYMGDVKHYLEYEKEMRHKNRPHLFAQNPAAAIDANGRPISPVQIQLQRQGAAPTFVPRDATGAPAVPAGHGAARPQMTMSTGRPSLRDMKHERGLGHRAIDQHDRFGRPQSPVHAALDEQRRAAAQRYLEAQSDRPNCEHPSMIEDCRDAGLVYPEEAHRPEQAAEIARMAIGGPERRMALNGAKASKRRRNYVRRVDANGLPYPFPPSNAVFVESRPLQRELREQHARSFDQGGSHMGANQIASWAGQAGLQSRCGTQFGAQGSPMRKHPAKKKSAHKRKRRGILGKIFRK